jgi:hypothetical protein
MKKLIGSDFGSYTFNPATRQITLTTGLTSYLTQEQVLLITNVTDGILIYSFADTSIGGTIASDVITLTYDTSSMSSSDRLQIYIDVIDNSEDLLKLVKRQTKLMESLGVVDTAQRLRVAVEAMPTVTVNAHAVTNTVGIGVANTVNTIGAPWTLASQNVNYISEGPISQHWRVLEDSHVSYALNIRSNLSFSS